MSKVATLASVERITRSARAPTTKASAGGCAAKNASAALLDAPSQAARRWLLQNRRLEKLADARFLVEETSPRAVCSAAGFPDFLCRGDGRHHATSSKVVQPLLEPRRLARSEALRVPSKVPAVSWADVERLDAALAAACRDLAAAYGYDADPRYHPQALDTTAFKA